MFLHVVGWIVGIIIVLVVAVIFVNSGLFGAATFTPTFAATDTFTRTFAFAFASIRGQRTVGFGDGDLAW